MVVNKRAYNIQWRCSFVRAGGVRLIVWGFRAYGFRVQGSGFGALSFRVQVPRSILYGLSVGVRALKFQFLLFGLGVEGL